MTIKVNLKTPSVTNASMTALMIAAKYDFPLIVAELVRCGAGLEERETLFSRTALHVAASFGQTHICRMLLRIGAKSDTLDGGGNTAAKVAGNENYHITSQIILGFSRTKLKAAPLIQFVLDKTMNPPKSILQKIAETFKKIGNFFSSAATNGVIKFFVNLGKLFMRCYKKNSNTNETTVIAAV